MNKPLTAVALAVIAAATTFASAAEAGFKVRLGFGGPLPAFTAHGNGSGGGYGQKKGCHKDRAARYQAVRVSKKAKPAVNVAKLEDKAEAKPEAVSQTAEAENSSIATQATKTAEAATAAIETNKVATAKEVGCKKFFPSVGMTLSVPCE